jgi:hypothetical protein
MMIHVNQVELELIEIRQLLVSADDAKFFGKKHKSCKEEQKLCSVMVRREVGLEVNAEKSKYKIMSCHQSTEC